MNGLRQWREVYFGEKRRHLVVVQKSQIEKAEGFFDTPTPSMALLSSDIASLDE